MKDDILKFQEKFGDIQFGWSDETFGEFIKLIKKETLREILKEVQEMYNYERGSGHDDGIEKVEELLTEKLDILDKEE